MLQPKAANVDYLIFLEGNNVSEFSNVKFMLDRKFNIKDLKNLKFFFGFEVI